MTTLYLSTVGTSPELASLASFATVPIRPSVLISFYFLPRISNSEQYTAIRGFKTMLDSGAYSAKNGGETVDINALIAEVKSGGWKETVALDVIGNPEASYANAVRMKEAGCDSFPTFHFGEPWEYLLRYAREFKKVGLGGLVPVRNKEERRAWLEECMSRIWPKKIHAFGVMDRETLMRFPFHSTDSTSWESRALCFGKYIFADNQRLGVGRSGARKAMGGMETHLRPEIMYYLRLEKEIKARWRLEFEKQGWI